MNVQPLLARCLTHDRKAWADLWEIVPSGVLALMQRMVHRRGRDASLANDILQDFYVYLQDEEGLHSLRSFHGSTVPQLLCFLHTLALRFTWRQLQAWQEDEDRERKACAYHATAQENGPIQEQFNCALDELIKIVSRKDLGRLGVLFMSEDAAQETGRPLAAVFPYSMQTFRKWIRELKQRYGPRLTMIP